MSNGLVISKIANAFLKQLLYSKYYLLLYVNIKPMISHGEVCTLQLSQPFLSITQVLWYSCQAVTNSQVLIREMGTQSRLSMVYELPGSSNSHLHKKALAMCLCDHVGCFLNFFIFVQFVRVR